MTSKPMSRRNKAFALVPIALLSGVWTASLVSASATANTASSTNSALPDGTTVPNAAIEVPASVPVPGVIAPAVPQGAADSVVSGASSNGIPSPALAAYQRGAQIIDAADKTCNIPWELIGAIGRVESDHGRYGGNTLTDDGVSKPGIFGIPLNGKNGTQAINDTDGGELDQDKVYDRAVGPMQFIPSTWQVVKVDADGDGKRNPQDMDDAALATAVYLCSGKDNLSVRKGQEAAVYRYNHSQDYVNLVLRIMEAYSSGDYTAVPSGTNGSTSYSPSYSTQIDRSYKVAKERKAKAAKAKAKAIANGTYKGGSGSGSGSSGGTSGGSTGGVPGGTSGGGLPGGGTGTGGTSKNPVGDVVNGVAGAVGGAIGGATGGGASTPKPTPTPTPTPDPVKQVLSYADAKAKCIAQGISVLDVNGLATCIANLRN
ncbi:MAG: Transglycosylase protein [Marmoricola sp.]|jgi:membrane-bound lytic murein transglycosylase B|nr:Transglycosylase protein [Marmoricola sp.]